MFTPDLDAASGSSLVGLLVAGGVAGVMGWLVTFPFDVVKTRVQSTDWTPINPHEREPLLDSRGSIGPKDSPYRTTLSTVLNSYRTEGVSVFYRGLAPTLIR